MIYALVYAGFAWFDAAPAIVAIFLAYGLYFGLTEGVEKAWIADLAPAAARGTAFGIYNAALGVGSACRERAVRLDLDADLARGGVSDRRRVGAGRDRAAILAVFQ